MANPAKKLSYQDEVMIWGNLSPWKRLGIRVSHTTEFKPDDVIRDGNGNILNMPVLVKKPCFGVPSAVFRHGNRDQKFTRPDGSVIYSQKHQCGSCPEGVRSACIETAEERVNSDPEIRDALKAWLGHCDLYHGGELTYTGPASRPWGALKKAIAARGPFMSANDKALQEREAQQMKDNKHKSVEQKRAQRRRARQATQSAQSVPSKQFLFNLSDERDNRYYALLEVLGKPDQPPSRSKVPASKREATAAITANAWAVRELFSATGQQPNPTKIARYMTENGLNAGTPFETLKARIKNDLQRADDCSKDQLWTPFDPDSDLASYISDDDEAADVYQEPPSDIDPLLKNIDI